MRYPACEKLEISQLIEQSHLPVRRWRNSASPGRPFTVGTISPGGPEALGDRSPRPDRVYRLLGA